jgi:hypothetical protein
MDIQAAIPHENKSDKPLSFMDIIGEKTTLQQLDINNTDQIP